MTPNTIISVASTVPGIEPMRKPAVNTNTSITKRSSVPTVTARECSKRISTPW